MKTDNHSPATECPVDVLGWIPWYPDGLEEGQRGAVEAHAADCRDCRNEIEMLQGGPMPDDGPEPERVYARVLARIEASRPESDEGPDAEEERAPATVSQLPVREPRSAEPARPARGWTRISLDRTQRGLALAAGLLAALALGALLSAASLGLGTGAGEPVYETASDTAFVSAAGGLALDVVLRDDASAADINGTLRELGARIVSGPSPLGVYRLELSADADLASAQQLLTGEPDGIATFAQKPLRP